MITIAKNGVNYILSTDNGEDEVIDWIMKLQPRKLERHIEEYLKSRKVNKEYHEDRELVRNMTPEEKQEYKGKIHARKLESANNNK